MSYLRFIVIPNEWHALSSIAIITPKKKPLLSFLSASTVSYMVRVWSQMNCQHTVTLQCIQMRLFDELSRSLLLTTQANIYSDKKKWQRDWDKENRERKHFLWCCLQSTPGRTQRYCECVWMHPVTCQCRPRYAQKLFMTWMKDWEKEGEERWRRRECWKSKRKEDKKKKGGKNKLQRYSQRWAVKINRGELWLARGEEGMKQVRKEVKQVGWWKERKGEARRKEERSGNSLRWWRCRENWV